MKYKMKAGVLYQEDTIQGRVEGGLCTRNRSIFSPEGQVLFHAEIREREYVTERGEKIKGHRYVMDTPDGQCYASAQPDYTPWEMAETGKLPANRIPKIDYAWLNLQDQKYVLIMGNSCTYRLLMMSGKKMVQINHCGIGGGWVVETWKDFPPAFLCGLFVFCRYLERENELLLI